MKVSVLIPTYKPNPQHLSETLESLMSQTESDWECIICDEPTEVDTHALVMDYLVDDRFSFHRNPRCLSIGGNWNACLQKAKGNVIAFLFQDDLWEPTYLQTALEIFKEHHDIGLISMNHRYQYDEDLWTKDGYELVKNVQKGISPGRHTGEEILNFWLQRNMHPNIIGEPPFVVMRKSLVESVGPFHENMPQFLDVEYWVRCLQQTNWYFEPKSLGAFRVHSNATSATNNASGRGLYDRLTVFEQLIGSLDGEAKKLAIQSRNRSIEDMIRKFLRRVQHKKGIASHGSTNVAIFAIKHPFVVTKALLNVLRKK